MDADPANPLLVLIGELAFAINVQFMTPWAAPVLLASLLVMVVGSLLDPGNRPPASWKYLLLPFLIPVMLLGAGVVFYWEYWSSDVSAFVLLILWGMLFLQAPVGIGLIIMMRGRRLFTLGVWILQVWVSFTAFAVAAMSVSGLGP